MHVPPLDRSTVPEVAADADRAADARGATAWAGALWLWTIRLAAAVALASSGYLLWASFQGRPAGCGAASGCGHVLASRWSRWLGVPVAAGGAAAYAAILMVTFTLRRRRRPRWRLLVGAAVLVLRQPWAEG